MALEQQRDLRRRHLGRGDQGGRPHGPRVHQPGAECEGPVERPRMTQPVLGPQAVPAVKHHPPRPDRAMRVAHRAGRAGGAGGINDIGHALGIAHVPVGGGQVVHRLQRGRVEDRQIGLGAGDVTRPQDQARRGRVDDPGHLGRGQLAGGGDRHQPHRDRPEIGHGKLHRVAKPHQHPVAGHQPRAQQPRPGAEDRRLQAGVAPAFGARQAQDGQRDLVGLRVRLPHHMGGEVEGRGAGGAGPLMTVGKHGVGLGGPRASCKWGRACL